MKKMSLIILMALLMAGCDKYEPLHFERTPYFGDEIRTDGFWYHVSYSQFEERYCMGLYFLYRDGTFLRALTPNTSNPNEVTIDSVFDHGYDYNNQRHWGLFKVEDGILQRTEWFWPGPGSGKALLYNYVIINDTCIQSEGEGDYYYFHPFEFKPDSTIARQWIP